MGGTDHPVNAGLAVTAATGVGTGAGGTGTQDWVGTMVTSGIRTGTSAFNTFAEATPVPPSPLPINARTDRWW